MSLFWNIYTSNSEDFNLAIHTAQTHFQQIVNMRAWSERHHGVYVPITKSMQPNSYLVDPLRDVTTTNGTKLTKIDSAYMTRQVAEITDANSEGVKIHLTSLKPIRPKNKPLEWEKKALELFEQNSRMLEFGEFHKESQKDLFRYIAPLFVKTRCLKCHVNQGYKVGDIRGGISVTLPFSKANKLPLWIGHGIIFIIGIIILWIAGTFIKSNSNRLKSTVNTLKEVQTQKNNFIVSLNHELRTPLTSIMGFTELLESVDCRCSEDEKSSYLLQIKHSSYHLLKLINELLDISKIETGSIAIRCQIIDLEKIISEALEMMKTQFIKKGLSITTTLNSTSLQVCADEKRVTQVFLNLLSNAYKFTPAGGKINIQVMAQGNLYLKILISDTGIGINEDQQDKIFEKFHQVNLKRDEALGGIGIGLALTKKIVTLQGGDIGVDSKLKKGSTFWFTLPITCK